MQPSTFASREPAAAAARAQRSKRRLASLGESEFRQRTKTGDVEIVAVELFIDYDKPSDKFVHFPGTATLIPLNDDKRVDEVRPLPPLPAGRRELNRPQSSAYEPSPADPPPRPVA